MYYFVHYTHLIKWIQLDTSQKSKKNYIDDSKVDQSVLIQTVSK